MIKLKKQTLCVTLALVIFLSASFASVQTSPVSNLEISGAVDPDGWTRGAFYESGKAVALDRVANATNANEPIQAFRESTSIVNNRLHKEAERMLQSEQQATWRAYVTEHLRSMTDGGKNSKISSPNLLKDWRDALRPVYFA